jgi:hypothetical protein
MKSKRKRDRKKEEGDLFREIVSGAYVIVKLAISQIHHNIIPTIVFECCSKRLI